MRAALDAGARRLRHRRRRAATSPTRSSSRSTTRRSSSASATGESFAASDIPAILAHTRDVILLEDGEMADAHRRAASMITTLDGTPVDARAEAHRLVADAGREGRLQALHAQGDPRAAARDRGHAARSRRPRRAADVIAAEIGVDRGAREEDRPRLLRRVRHERARRDGRSLLDRAARARPVDRRDRRARSATAIRSSRRTTSSSR